MDYLLVFCGYLGTTSMCYNYFSMKQYFSSVATQVTAIVLAATGAAAFTFFQSVASQTGVCPAPVDATSQAGVLGALFKGAHSAFQALHFKHLV